jgi:predicted small lipoprotein YifL
VQHCSLIALLIVMTLPACGYKGPLTLAKEDPAKPVIASHQPNTDKPSAEKPMNQQDNKQ